MSDYKRWISYMYVYEDNIKKNNVGYIRVEQRDKTARISIHIKVMSITEPMKVYLYVRHDNNMKGIYIGDIELDKSAAQPTYHMETEVAADLVDISDTGGVIVYHGNDRFFGSEWDDVNISIDEFDCGQEDMPEIDNDDNAAEFIATSLEEAGEEKCDEPATAETEAETWNNEISEDELCESQCDLPGDIIDDDEKVMNQNDMNKDDIHIEEANEEDIRRQKIEEAAKKMLASYPKMFPFENDDKMKCVRIEPQDIGQLPIDTWILANNSFLLQGYYSYRHLMLMSTGDEIRPAYLIGVPGIYRGRDEYMAQMFGFGLFKPMKACDNLRGEFGYWCISLTSIPESRKYK